jgi:2-methylcitrate dehydratase PrpD
LAQKGFTGARKILEGEKGFFRATSGDFEPSKCLADLGKTFFFERNSLKYHASCGHTHSAIDATLQATGGKTFDPDAIEKATVSVYQGALDLLAAVEPKNPYLAKFNLPFCIASALLYGHAELADFSTQRLNDPCMLRMMQKIELRSDPELTAMYPRKWPARVEILKPNGERLAGSVTYPKGDPENPLSEAEVVAKFKSLTRGLIADERADALCERALSLERLDDVSAFFGR